MESIVRFDREECLHLETALRREWLETDGRGGYASSTILMCPTRRYHGLLVSTLPGTAKRHSFLSRFEETIHGPGRSFAVSMAAYPGVWSPHGHNAIEGFELGPFPRARYRVGRVGLTREILAARTERATLVRYTAAHPHDDLEMRLRPLLTFREADALTSANLDLDPRVRRIPGGVLLHPYAGLPPLCITVSGVEARFEADPVWYRRIEYRRDIARGYDGEEDQFSPGWFTFPLHPVTDVVVAASLHEPVEDAPALWSREASARVAAMEAAPPGLEGVLGLGADAYLASDDLGRRGVVAGFPWFGEWGRDTFIALPGLTLARGRVEECGEVLEGALAFLRDGALPNVYGADGAGSAYASSDTGLWFLRAVGLFEDAGGDPHLLERRLRPACTEILRAHVEGRIPGITMDDGGLLVVDGSGEALSWMDARINGAPVTPRTGCPVEVNALWYAALARREQGAKAAGRTREAREWGGLRRRAGVSFLDRFWMPEEGRLADAWRDGVRDGAVRPNMVIAAALADSPLHRSQREGVVEWAEAELLTPMGLRTLSPRHPDYRGRYAGPPADRDHAYHQGTVWPWLAGFYVEACLRARSRRRSEKERLREHLAGFAGSLPSHGLGPQAAVHARDPPPRPGGCIAQAWRDAEVLRAFALLRE